MRFNCAVSVMVVSSVIGLGGCASSGGKAEKPMEENAVIHQVSEADKATAHGATPIASDKAVLWVNGLGCPQCASNIDLQLLKVKGVKGVRVDLGAGKVAVDLTGSARPSPDQLAKAVDRAGFTLVKVETN